MKFSDRADIRDNTKVRMTIRPNSEDKVVIEIESKISTKISYKLDLLIFVNNYAENFSSYNLVDVLANLFNNLSLISIDFRFFSAFSVSSFHLAIFDSVSGLKFFNFTLLSSLATCNSENILVFYH